MKGSDMSFGFSDIALKVYNSFGKDNTLGKAVQNEKGEVPTYTNDDNIGLVFSADGGSKSIGLDFDGDGKSDLDVNMASYSDSSLAMMGFSERDIKIIKGFENGAVETDDIEKARQAEAANKASSTTNTNNLSLDQLKKQRETNLKEMDELEGRIENLAKDAAKKIADAIDRQQKLSDEHKEAVQEAVKAAIANYTDQVKKSQDGGPTPDSKNVGEAVQKAIQGLPGLGDDAVIISNMAVATAEINTIESLVGNLKTLINETKNLESQIKSAEEAAAAAKKDCDPIGFEFEGSEFDFVVMDEDGFNTTSDFLGADGTNFGAMTALDGKGGEKDNKVDLNELKNNNIGLLDKKTGKVMNADEIKAKFGENFSINLDFDKNGKYDGINTGDHDNDGVANQQLLGTFTLNIGDQKITGFDTLDDQDWLAQEYGITANVGNNAATNAATSAISAELQAHIDKLEGDGQSKDATFRSITDDEAGTKAIQSIGYQNVANVLRAGLEEAREEIGMSEDFLKELDGLMKDGAKAEAERIHVEFIAEVEKQNKAEEAEQAQERKADVVTDEEGFYISKTTGKYVDAEGNEVLEKVKSNEQVAA